MGRCNQLEEKHPSLCLLNTPGCHWPWGYRRLGGQVLFNLILTKEDGSSHDLCHSNQDLKKYAMFPLQFSLSDVPAALFSHFCCTFTRVRRNAHTHTHIHTAAAVRPAWP